MEEKVVKKIISQAQKEASKRYYEKNRERIIEQVKAKKLEKPIQPEIIVEYNKGYYEKKKDVILEKRKVFYDENKSRLIAKNMERYKTVKDDPEFIEKRNARARERYKLRKEQQKSTVEDLTIISEDEFKIII
jgi:hypothetical protein